MVLVDTSVWIDHLRRGNAALAALLIAGQVLCHAAVIGEIACAHVRRRVATLGLLQRLPHAVPASDAEAMRLIEDHRLFGRGLGWTDVHLLAAAALSTSRLWTFDGKLADACRLLGVAHKP